MRFRAPVAAVAAAALTVITATSAFGDIVTNDLPAQVDSEMELMTLQYDTADGIAGPAGSTTLSIVIEGKEASDHPGCNIQGGSHYLVLEAAFNPAIVGVSLSNGGRFNSCTDTVVATVTPRAVGATTITFTGDGRTNGDPRTDFDYAPADFRVVVEEADLSENPGTGTTCDAHPAAPAWAAALLQGNDHKPKKGKNAPNYIAMVAHEMGQRAAWPDGNGGWIPKDQDGYADGVWNFLKGELGDAALRKGPSEVARPGWECTTLPGSSS